MPFNAEVQLHRKCVFARSNRDMKGGAGAAAGTGGANDSDLSMELTRFRSTAELPLIPDQKQTKSLPQV